MVLLGKAFLLLAGLVAVLDVLGATRLKAAAERAGARRDRMLGRKDELTASRSVAGLAYQMGVHAAAGLGPPPGSERFFTPDQYHHWATRTRADLFGKGLIGERTDHAVAAGHFERRAHPLLADCVGADEQATSALAAYKAARDGIQRRAQRIFVTGASVGVLGLPFVIGAALLTGQGAPGVVTALAVAMAIIFGAMAVAATNAVWVLAAFQARVSHGVFVVLLRALGRNQDGFPVRITALTLFVAGSFLDMSAEF
ncbi:hypothetical protein [Micromonospora sp. KC213]|uniref:hypothetical protein n=1 Tax=Micromonospora sp. KC213 TaxID=2530378 RepID=UPI0010522706|nr:hypothetical protein [Micromonospora sp. KC213]TDC43836.1 hypothetical protein E1166_02260 [Micromonospora sp. KC213]